MMTVSFIVARINLRCQLDMVCRMGGWAVHLEFTGKVGLEFCICRYDVEMPFKATRLDGLAKEMGIGKEEKRSKN